MLGRYKCRVKTLRDSASGEVPLRVTVNAPVIIKHSADVKVTNQTQIIFLKD